MSDPVAMGVLEVPRAVMQVTQGRGGIVMPMEAAGSGRVETWSQAPGCSWPGGAEARGWLFRTKRKLSAGGSQRHGAKLEKRMRSKDSLRFFCLNQRDFI